MNEYIIVTVNENGYRKGYTENDIYNFVIFDGIPKDDHIPKGIYLGKIKKIIKDRYENDLPIATLTKIPEGDTLFETAISLFDLMPRNRDRFEKVLKVLENFNVICKDVAIIMAISEYNWHFEQSYIENIVVHIFDSLYVILDTDSLKKEKILKKNENLSNTETKRRV
jgi:hypothetical protein